MHGENIKNLADSIFTEYKEDDPGRVTDILKDINKYDYIIIETTFDLLDYINKESKDICVINLPSNKYFCSKNYCLIRDKIHRFDKINLTTHYCDNHVSYSFIAKNEDFFIKFCSSINMQSFYEETKREIEFLNEYANCGIDFIDRQKIYDYYISDEYIISTRKLVKGDFLNREMIAKISDDKKLFILEELVKQLIFLENKGIIYNDLSNANVMFDDTNVTLIDLGSYRKYPSNRIRYLYDIGRNSRNSFSIYDSITTFIYNLFNIFGGHICRNKHYQKVANKVTNIYNYSPNVTNLVIEVLRLKYKSSCNFANILDIIEKFKKNKNKPDRIRNKTIIKSIGDINYMDAICDIKKQELNTIIDICYFRNNVRNNAKFENKAIKYLQICQNNNLIAENRLYFNEDQNKIFINLDILKEPLPNADIICCIDLFENLNNDQIWIVLENIKHSKSKCFAVSYYSNNKNIGKNPKKKNKYTSLIESPFNFPPPSFIIPTTIEDSYIAVYNTEDIDFFMKYHDDFMLNVRQNLYKYLKNNLKKLVNIFSKYDNGLELLKEALSANALDWDNFYYDKKYRNIIDNNNIFDEYIDTLLLIYKSDLKRFKEDNKNEHFFDILNTDNYAQFSLIAREFVVWELSRTNI